MAVVSRICFFAGGLWANLRGTVIGSICQLRCSRSIFIRLVMLFALLNDIFIHLVMLFALLNDFCFKKRPRAFSNNSGNCSVEAFTPFLAPLDV